MVNLVGRCVLKIATAILVSALFLTSTAYAADSPAGATPKQQDGQSHVEMRIKTLHDKLKVTAEQEPKWAAVAEVMRNNESSIHKLAERRHKDEAASAVEDLKSYESIADAHADGLKKLIPVFEDFYNNLSGEQKANADNLFGKFEGHESNKADVPKESE